MNLSAWWNSLDTLLRILYVIAVPATLLLLLQLVLAIVGFAGAGMPDAGGLDAGDPGGLDGDLLGQPDLDMPQADILDLPDGDFIPTHHTTDFYGHDPGVDALRLFSLSGIVSFFTVFSWSAILMDQSGVPGGAAVALGLIPGFAAMYLTAKILQLSGRLTESGTMRLENAIDMGARVYIPIPGMRGGAGKVTLILHGAFVELSAVTDEETIPSGTAVVVTAVEDGALVVARDTTEESN